MITSQQQSRFTCAMKTRQRIEMMIEDKKNYQSNKSLPKRYNRIRLSERR